MAKEIDLVMSPNLAPEALKKSVDDHKVSYNKLVKAKTKFSDSRKELNIAQDEFNKTQDAYLSNLEKWEVK